MKALFLGLLALFAVEASAFTGVCPGSLIPLDPNGGQFTVSTCGQGNTYTPHNYPGTRQGQDIAFKIQMPAGPYSVTICPQYASGVVEIRDLANGVCDTGVYGAARVLGSGRCKTASYTGFDAPRELGIFLDSAQNACGTVDVTIVPTPSAE